MLCCSARRPGSGNCGQGRPVRRDGLAAGRSGALSRRRAFSDNGTIGRWLPSNSSLGSPEGPDALRRPFAGRRLALAEEPQATAPAEPLLPTIVVTKTTRGRSSTAWWPPARSRPGKRPMWRRWSTGCRSRALPSISAIRFRPAGSGRVEPRRLLLQKSQNEASLAKAQPP